MTTNKVEIRNPVVEQKDVAATSSDDQNCVPEEGPIIIRQNAG